MKQVNFLDESTREQNPEHSILQQCVKQVKRQKHAKQIATLPRG